LNDFAGLDAERPGDPGGKHDRLLANEDDRIAGDAAGAVHVVVSRFEIADSDLKRPNHSIKSNLKVCFG
jgi:hypothetical protein